MNEQLKQLDNRHQAIRTARLIRIPILLGAIACGFFASTIGGIALALAVTAIQFGFIHPQNKKYAASCNRYNLEQTLQKKLNAPEVSESTGISEEEVRNAGLFPVAEQKKAVLGLWGMEGHLSSYPAALSDVCVFYVYREGNRNSQGSFAGSWVCLDLPLNSKMDWVVMDGEFEERGARDDILMVKQKMEKRALSQEKLNERFAFYIAKGSGQPSPEAIEKIINLADYSTGKICAALRGERLYVLLRHRVLAGNVNINVRPTEKNLNRDPLPELDYIKKLADVIVQMQSNK